MDGISQLIYDRPSQSPGGFYENDLALAMRVVDLFDAVDRNRLGPDSDTQRQRDDNRADSHTGMVSGDRRSFDLGTFNPVNRLIYFGDGTNHAVTTVDTVTNTFVSSINPPGCTTPSCPSGIQVAPDLQKLVVTSRQTTDWIYDLKTPGAPPVTLTVPSGSDELDYDPIHQRVYVANTNAPFFLVGIDLAGPNANTIVAQIPLPGNPEQRRFNPVD